MKDSAGIQLYVDVYMGIAISTQAFVTQAFLLSADVIFKRYYKNSSSTAWKKVCMTEELRIDRGEGYIRIGGALDDSGVQCYITMTADCRAIDITSITN